MSANDRKIPHYDTEYQHWDLAIKIPLGYLDGCSTKYVTRWRHKNGIDDLHKALHYLEKLIESYAPKPIARNLNRSEIAYEVHRFAAINKLSLVEEEYVLALCQYKYPHDLMAARTILEDIIELAGNQPELPPEINRPGTPEDGGHHATAEDE